MKLNKRTVLDYWQALERSGNSRIGRNNMQLRRYGPMLWNGPDPIDQPAGHRVFRKRFLVTPYLNSFPGLKRHTQIFFGGKSSGRIDGLADGEMWVCGSGYFSVFFPRTT